MLPIHLDLGFRVFYFYEGMYFVIAIIAAYLWSIHRVKAEGLSADRFSSALFWVFLGAILGARLSHFLFWDAERFFRDPAMFLSFWEGGFSITGGLAGGMLGGAIYMLAKREDFWRYFAVVSPAVFLGQAVGRIGCFLNGDAWGIPTSLPWGVSQPKFATRVPAFQTDTSVASPAWEWSRSRGFTSESSLVTVPLHPTQLYEAVGDGILILAVLWLFAALKRSGRSFAPVFFVHAGGYALLRFALEFLHGDKDALVWSGMTLLQLNLLGVGILFLGMLGFFLRKDDRRRFE